MTADTIRRDVFWEEMVFIILPDPFSEEMENTI